MGIVWNWQNTVDNNSWRIVCVKRRIISHPRPHVHIIGIGTGESASWADMRWTSTQALAALKEGDTFYILDEDSEQQVQVAQTKCALCNKIVLSANSGTTQQENLRDCLYKPDPEVNFSDS